MAAETMRAVVCSEPRGTLAEKVSATTFAKPTPLPNEVLVKIYVAALNPIDHIMVSYGLFVQQSPSVLGCEFSGVVEKVGSEVLNFAVGDEVFGYSALGAPRGGAFAEYLCIPAHQPILKPATLTHAEACAMPVGIFTSALALFFHLGLPNVPTDAKPAQRDQWILIWGASSTVGGYGVQLAVQSGLKVVATCSPAQFDYVRGLGASAVFDYRDPEVVSKIKAATNHSCRFAYDCAGDAKGVYDVLVNDAGTPGEFAIVSQPTGLPKEGERAAYIKMHTPNLGYSWNVPEQSQFLQDTAAKLIQLLDDDRITACPTEQLADGLNSVVDGLQRLQSGKVSGRKLLALVVEA